MSFKMVYPNFPILVTFQLLTKAVYNKNVQNLNKIFRIYNYNMKKMSNNIKVFWNNTNCHYMCSINDTFL